jgi:hypothetical protein
MSQSQKLVLDTDLLRARVMSEEYEHLDEKDIRRIYIQETGSEPPAQIRVYHSQEFKSGFDGTIIHFYDEEKGINQMYTIARGSETLEKDTQIPEDWGYNTFGIFVGKNRSQYNDALRFDEMVTQKITEELKRNGQTIELKKIALGHSLGGNLVQTIQLTEHRFDQVYVINDAPPSVYQLAYIDIRFRYELAKKKFNPYILFKPYLIASIPPSELKAFAEEYYKKQIDEHSIHHLTAEEDLLYAVTSGRSLYIDIGSRRVIDTNKDFTSIKDLIAKISDKDVKTIQLYLSKYSGIYEEKGFDGVVQAMTGVDFDFIKSLRDYNTIDYLMDIDKIERMYDRMSEEIPPLLEDLGILKNLDPILSVFVQFGYMTVEEKNTVLREVKGIVEDLKSIDQLRHELWNSMMDWKRRSIVASSYNPFFSPATSVATQNISLIISTLYQIGQKALDIVKRLQVIQKNTKKLQNAIDMSVDAHSLDDVINALARSKGRAYDENGDLILIKKVGEQEIRVNLSSAVRIYQKGLQIMERKEAVLREMKQSYLCEYVEDFERQKQELMKKIEDMEQNPWAYRHLLGHFTDDAKQVYALRRIDVHESIPQLHPRIPYIFEKAMFLYYEHEISRGKELIETIRKSFEEFFEQDQNLSKIFDLRY